MGAFTKIFQRLKLTADTNVSTQTTTVIAADTTNSNIAIVPNGTGALVADIPDGTATGGNARGTNAVDLQMARYNNAQVASGNFSFVGGGTNNRANGITAACVGGDNNFANGFRSFVGAGLNNSATGQESVIGGGNGNSAGATFAAILGGQGNTASSGTYAVILGGIGNTASGQFSAIGGGQTNVASGTHSTVVGGQSNTASGPQSIAGGSSSIASGAQSLSIGLNGSTASGQASVVLGYGSYATDFGSIALSDSSLSYLKSQVSIASGTFSGFTAQRGEAQQSLLTARREATLASNATTVLSLDGTGVTNLLIPLGNNRVWAVKVIATAVVSYALPFMTLGDSYMAEYTLLFKKIGGVSSVVGVIASNVIFNTNMVDASFSFAAGASQDLQITFKAPSISGFSIYRCVARVELTEVTY